MIAHLHRLNITSIKGHPRQIRFMSADEPGVIAVIVTEFLLQKQIHSKPI